MANGGDLDKFTVKEILTQFILPELEKKADRDDFRADLRSLEKDVRNLQAKILTPDSVATMIGVALEKKDARGWTSKERAIAVILVTCTAVGVILALVQLAVQISG